jgi:hypothetical protein
LIIILARLVSEQAQLASKKLEEQRSLYNPLNNRFGVQGAMEGGMAEGGGEGEGEEGAVLLKAALVMLAISCACCVLQVRE